MENASLRHFRVFLDRYYWLTAFLIMQTSLSRQYRNSVLGSVWTLLQPASMALLYAFVMPLISRISSRSDYVLYILVSLPLWNFISGALVVSSSSIIGNGEVLKRCSISSTIFPVSDVMRCCHTFFISFGTSYCLCLLLGLTHLSLPLLLLPVYLAPVLIILFSTAIAVSYIAPSFRDIGDVIGIVLSAGFWLTPIVYSFSLLSEGEQNILIWNPFYIMIRPIQQMAVGGVVPGTMETVRLMLLMMIAIVIGFHVFRRYRRNAVYYL